MAPKTAKDLIRSTSAYRGTAGDLLLKMALTTNLVVTCTFREESDGARTLRTLAIGHIGDDPVIRLPGIADGEPLTPEGLKDLPLALLAEQAAEIAATIPSFGPSRSPRDALDASFRALLDSSARGYRDVSDQFLAQVARQYKADETGAPRQAVADTFGASLRTASRWISEARARGLLSD